MKLKPCPFCGKQPKIFPEDYETEGDAWTEITCVNQRCGANPTTNRAYSDNPDTHQRTAARRWNTRRQENP